MSEKRRLLPPARLAISLVAVLFLHLYLPIVTFRNLPLIVSGNLMLLFGLFMTASAAGAFKRAGTPVVPFERSTKLLVDGWYRYTRNPMYLGLALILLGAGIALGSLGECCRRRLSSHRSSRITSRVKKGSSRKPLATNTAPTRAACGAGSDSRGAPARRRRKGSALPGSPFLTHIGLKEDKIQPGIYPFTLPLLEAPLDIRLSTPVTFLVGENGAGKSTLFEALAWAAGFGQRGGHRDQSFAEGADGHTLGRALRMGWRQRVTGGFFLRAETFFNFASYLEEVGSTFESYGGKSLHDQSHGEASSRCSATTSKMAFSFSTSPRRRCRRSVSLRSCASSTTSVRKKSRSSSSPRIRRSC